MKKMNDFLEQSKILEKKGWEISMHGFSMFTTKKQIRKIILIMEEDLSFVDMIIQYNFRIKKGLKKFEDEKIK